MGKMKDFATTVKEDGIIWAASDLFGYRNSDILYSIYCIGYEDEHIMFRGADRTLYRLDPMWQGDDETLISLRLHQFNDEDDVGYIAIGIDQCFNLLCDCIELAEGTKKYDDIEIKPEPTNENEGY